MKNLSVYIILAYVALMTQSIIFKGPKPDLILVLVCFFALRSGMVSGLFYGAFCGLLLDLASGFMIGPNFISKLIASFLTRTVSNSILAWNGIVNLLVIVILSIVDVITVYFCYEVFSDISFANRAWNTVVWQVLFTAVSGLILYNVMHPERENIINSAEL